MIIAMLILTILVAAFFSGKGYSILQQQTTSDTEKAQAHLTDCRNHFLELLQKANGILEKAYGKYINNNCADVFNTSIIKQIPLILSNLNINRSLCFVCLLDFPFLYGISGVYGKDQLR